MNLSLPLHQNWSRTLNLVLVWAVGIVFRWILPAIQISSVRNEALIKTPFTPAVP